VRGSYGGGFGWDNAEREDTSSNLGHGQPRKIKDLQGDDLGRGKFEGENIKDLRTLIHLLLKKNPLGFYFALSSQLL
jgi:hypothetical protein